MTYNILDNLNNPQKESIRFLFKNDIVPFIDELLIEVSDEGLSKEEERQLKVEVGEYITEMLSGAGEVDLNAVFEDDNYPAGTILEEVGIDGQHIFLVVEESTSKSLLSLDCYENLDIWENNGSNYYEEVVRKVIDKDLFREAKARFLEKLLPL